MINNSPQMSSSREPGIDVLKCICAFMVMCAHVPLELEYREYILLITRMSVPAFFMITGYFYESTAQKNSEFRQMKKIAHLIVFSTALYILVDVIKLLAEGQSLAAYFRSTFAGAWILRLVLFNRSPVSVHLWYLYTVLYTLAVVFYFRKKGKMKILYFATPFLFLIDIFGTYSYAILGKTLWYFYFRNFMFFGLPNFMIGYMVRVHKDSIKSFLNSITKHPVILLTAFSVVTYLFSFYEYYFLSDYIFDGRRESYLSAALFGISIFAIFALYYKERGSKLETLCRYIGCKQSSTMYVYHPIVIDIFTIVLTGTAFYDVYTKISPIIIFVFMSAALYVTATVKKHMTKPFLKSISSQNANNGA